MLDEKNPFIKKKTSKELFINFFQIIYILSLILLDLLENKFSFLEIIPNKFLFSQLIDYISMIIAGLMSFFLHKLYFINSYKGFQELSFSSSFTLTLLDICSDTSIIISKIYLKTCFIDSILIFQPLVQFLFSFLIFSYNPSILEIISIIFQIIGYIIIIYFINKNNFYQDFSFPFSIYNHILGGFFVIISIFLKISSQSITQSLSSSVKMTAGSFCRSNGVIGFIIISIFYFSSLSIQSIEINLKELLLNNYKKIIFIIFLTSINHYSCFWLVLKTKAIEYSRIWLLSILILGWIKVYFFHYEIISEKISFSIILSIFFTIIGILLLNFITISK